MRKISRSWAHLITCGMFTIIANVRVQLLHLSAWLYMYN